MNQLNHALVLDDDPQWNASLTEILSDLGYQTHPLKTLNELYALEPSKISFAVVDLSLVEQDHTNHDGLMAARWIAQHNPHCTIWLLTGYATVEVAVEAMRKHDVSHVIRKEKFNLNDFIQQIEEVQKYPNVSISHPMPVELDIEAGIAPNSSVNPEILVIDDEADWRQAIAELINEIGYSATGCPGYAEAVTEIRRKRFNAAVLDLKLAGDRPGSPRQETEEVWSGLQLIRLLQAQGIPFMVLSGVEQNQSMTDLIDQYQIIEFLSKQNFDRAYFLDRLNQLIWAPRETLSGITNRELDVYRLLAEGKTNKEIASVLMISTNTVKRHIKSIYAKLGIHNRSSAVAYFSKNR